MNPCPPDDRLASLIDGRADATERAALLAHLSECADCYEVFTETARWQESAGEREPAPVASLAEARRRRAGAPTWLAAAAAVVVALTAAVLMRPSDPAAQHVAGGPATPPAVTPTPTVVAVPVPVPSTAVASVRPPAWLTAAPWGTRSGSRAFAPRELAFVLGLHGAALTRAARIPDGDERHSAVEWIRTSLRARTTIDADVETRFSAALDGKAPAPCAVAAGDRSRRDLAAFLEAWRIDAFERRPQALHSTRADELSRRLAAAGMADELRIPAKTLRTQLEGPSPTFEDVGDGLADLIEALDP